jgi:hypothetical protein
MQVRVARLPLSAAGLVVIVAMAASGCSASSSSRPGAAGSSASAGAAGSSSTTPANALDAVKLAAKTASGANSFTGTMSLHGTVNPGVASSAGVSGGISMTGTFAEQLHPTLLVSADIGSYSMLGTSLPGGLTELITPSAIYLKSAQLTQELHLTKPWLAMSLSAASKNSGLNLSQLVNQATGSGPLTQAQMLGASSSVREVGTGSIGGVPVTEYAGTIPVVKAISTLSGGAKAEMEQMNSAAGLTTEKYTVWIDGQHIMRKAVITGTGATLTETATVTFTSVNQPVNIAVPPASQTTSLPSSDQG